MHRLSCRVAGRVVVSLVVSLGGSKDTRRLGGRVWRAWAGVWTWPCPGLASGYGLACIACL